LKALTEVAFISVILSFAVDAVFEESVRCDQLQSNDADSLLITDDGRTAAHNVRNSVSACNKLQLLLLLLLSMWKKQPLCASSRLVETSEQRQLRTI